MINENQVMSTPTPTAEDNRAAAIQWIDAFNTRDDPREAGLRMPDYIAHTPESIGTAPLDSVQDSAADEGMVAQRILFTGTHTGNFRGLPPTNRKVRFSGIEINRMVDGKVAEHWFQLDQVTLFRQLGLLVVPGPRLVPRLLTHQARKLFRKRPSTAHQ